MAEFYPTLRRVLFRLDPERVHDATLRLAQLAGAVPPIGALARRWWGPAADPVDVFGCRFPNRLGIAAGFDKDAIAWRGLSRLGIGHVEVGTVTPQPQAGNPKPRVFRLPEDRALINRMGFPSRGADYVARRLAGRRVGDTILGVNIGKAAPTPLERAEDDYVSLLDRFVPLADYITVNVSSPNTPGLRTLQSARRLEDLMGVLVRHRNELTPRRPLLVKLAPDLPPEELAETIEAVLTAGIDGIVATNTSTARPGLSSPRSAEPGGLSGAPLGGKGLAVVEEIARRTAGKVPIIASGGVMGFADAQARLEAGATLVQIYTGLIYGGPRSLREAGSVA